MELSYWRSKWRKGQIGFHMKNGYPGLEAHWNSFDLPENPTAFVPLCGKSKDIFWLSNHCKHVLGVEISELAIQQFFEENSLPVTKTTFADFTIYSSGNIELWNGDFFKLPEEKIPSLDLIFDRAALVALPTEMRKTYAKKILQIISDHTQILQHVYYYPQKEMNGPPFSVSIDELKELYGDHFRLKVLEEVDLNVDKYKNFQNRGLDSYFIEILSLLFPMEENRAK